MPLPSRLPVTSSVQEAFEGAPPPRPALCVPLARKLALRPSPRRNGGGWDVKCGCGHIEAGRRIPLSHALLLLFFQESSCRTVLPPKTMDRRSARPLLPLPSLPPDSLFLPP